MLCQVEHVQATGMDIVFVKIKLPQSKSMAVSFASDANENKVSSSTFTWTFYLGMLSTSRQIGSARLDLPRPLILHSQDTSSSMSHCKTIWTEFVSQKTLE